MDYQDPTQQDPSQVASEGLQAPPAEAPLVQPIVPDLLDVYKAEEFAAKYMKEFERWETWRRSYEGVWNKVYKLFISGNTEENKTTTRAKISLPIVFQVVEAAVPKVINVIFGSDGFFDVVPTSMKDGPMARVIKLLLSFQLGQADFFIKFMDFTKQLMLYGTSYLKVYWKVTRKWVWERTAVRTPKTYMGFNIGEEITWTVQKTYKIVERRPEVDVLDVLDVFPDPDASNEKEGQAIWIRSWISYDELSELSKGKYPVYGNIPDKSTLSGTDTSFTNSRGSRLSARQSSEQQKQDSSKLELLERWGLCDLDGDGIAEETYIAIVNRKTLVHADGNPFHHQKRPIVRSVLFTVPKEWFGIGLIEPVLPLIHELNTLRRQRLDNINLAINRMWSVNAYADIDLGTLVSTPGGIVLRGDNPMDIVALESPNVTDQNYNEAAIVQNDIEAVTAPKSIQGAPDSGKLGRTARGAQLIIGQALEKFGTAVKMVEETAIKRVLRMFHQLNLQFISDDEVFLETGLYGNIFDQKVTPEMIRAEVTFQMKGISEMVDKEGQVNRIMSFMGIFGKVLAPESISALAKKSWGLMGFDEDEVNIVAVQPMPPEPGQDQAVQGQVDQNGAGSPPAIPGVNSNG